MAALTVWTYSGQTSELIIDLHTIEQSQVLGFRERLLRRWFYLPGGYVVDGAPGSRGVVSGCR